MKHPRAVASLTAALALALTALFALSAEPTQAQEAPFTAYGVGLTAGASVSAVVKSVTCATVTADAGGNWLISIASTAPCKPKTGDVISFKLNGQATNATETWRVGGAPTDIANGVALVAGPDTKPPVVTAPAAINVTVAEGVASAPSTTATIVTFLAAGKATDLIDGTVAVTNNAPAAFPVGTTTVTFSATDKAGNTGTATSTVTVKVSAGAGTFLAQPSGSGVNTALWNGGSIEQAVDAAGASLNSIWIYEGGKAIGYTVGAPSFVNSVFFALFPGVEIPSGQIMILVMS
ncbi:MAG: HYR domain-containing protein [Chloroflexi bacterium]|nr:HYR domain-containing protein [Chloroflexota bacterium]